MQPGHNQLDVELPSIPDELITEILLYLPVKSLMRFKIVCKSLNFLISNTHFVKRHLCQCSTLNDNPHVLYISSRHVMPGSDNDFASFPVKSLLETPPLTITKELQFFNSNLEDIHMVIGSCNGLICLFGYRTLDPFFCDDYGCVSFCNPATRSTSKKWLKMPFTRKHAESICCGFGYDHVSDAYKIAMLVLQTNQIFVLSMGDKNWREVESYSFSQLNILLGYGVYLKETLNWVVFREIDMRETEGIIMVGEREHIIISFDLNKEKCVNLSLPTDIPYHELRQPELGVLGECLCVSHTDNREHFMIWQMKKFRVDGSWVKLLDISYRKDIQPYDLPFPFWFPTYMFDNGDVLMHAEELVYRPKNNRFDVLELPNNLRYCTAIIYSQSLITPF